MTAAYWGVEDADAALERLLHLGATESGGVHDVGGDIRVFDAVLTHSATCLVSSRICTTRSKVRNGPLGGLLRFSKDDGSQTRGGRMEIETIDLSFMGEREIIASFLITGDSSAAIVETGPTSCMEELLRGLKGHGVAPEDVAQVLLTHVHLDHAGASGNLVEVLPNATFYVHEVGYPHMADPSKLLKSATRIYGERMDELWGETRPVPEDRLVALKGEGEEIEAAGCVLTAHDTPGHAYHHLAFHEPESGALFAGDVAGIRLPGQSYVRPPTPPPEVDVEAWNRSIQEIRRISPSAICPTHFGRFEDVERHLSELEQRLQDWLLFVEERIGQGRSQEEIAAELKDKGDAEMLAEGSGPENSGRYDLAGNYEMLVAGIARYATRRREKK